MTEPEQGTASSARSRSPRKWIPSIPGVVLIYWLIAVVWIIGSDLLLGSLRNGIDRGVLADIGKGLAFVTVTAVLIYVLLDRRERLLAAERARIAQLEADLNETERMDAVGRLARGTAHDVNNLLAVIRGHVDLARLDAPPEQFESLDAIDQALDRTVELTRDLQTVAGRQNLDLGATDLGRYIESQHPGLRAVLPSTIDLTVELPEPTLHVLLDPARFEQVLLNLTTNAADAMPEGGQLRIRLLHDDEDAIIEVSDTGQGMADEVAKHCFEPFYSTKPRGTRNGMGLSLAYGVVRQSGGQIEVFSRPGKGTTFEIRLPLASGATPTPD